MFHLYSKFQTENNAIEGRFGLKHVCSWHQTVLVQILGVFFFCQLPVAGTQKKCIFWDFGGPELWYKRFTPEIKSELQPICRWFPRPSSSLVGFFPAPKAAIICPILCLILGMFMSTRHFILFFWIRLLDYCWLYPHCTWTILDWIICYLSTPDFLHVFTGLNEFKSTSSVGRTRKIAIFLCEIITGVNHFSPPLIIPRRSRRNVLCALVASTRSMYSGDLDSHCESYVMATR